MKEGLGPFLSWPLLQRLLRWLTSPPVALLAFAVSTIFWHLPKFYELRSSVAMWHGVQHASFSGPEFCSGGRSCSPAPEDRAGPSGSRFRICCWQTF